MSDLRTDGSDSLSSEVSRTRVVTLVENVEYMPVTYLTDTFLEKFYEITGVVFNEMVLGTDPNYDEIAAHTEIFRKNIYCVKAWYKRISWANKKKALFAFLDDMNLVWGFSRLLKAIWKCKTKDAVHSANDIQPWTGYDTTPLDHNRAAAPQGAIDGVIKEFQKWFKGLHAEHKTRLLLELLEVSDGPLQCAVFTKAYEKFTCYRKAFIDACALKPFTLDIPQQTGPHLAEWLAATREIRTTIKMDELIMFDNEDKVRVWRFAKPKPENVETLDMIQFLPSIVVKKIFSYIPKSQLPIYSRVNKYWAYIIEDYLQEINVRLKIDMELNRLRAQINRNEVGTTVPLVPDNSKVMASTQSRSKSNSTPVVTERRRSIPSIKPTTLRKKRVYKPIKRYADIDKRINLRGAADEAFLRYRCTEMLTKEIKMLKKVHHTEREHGGFISSARLRIVCPFLQNFDDEEFEKTAAEKEVERRRRPNLWTLNLLRWYPVWKL